LTSEIGVAPRSRGRATGDPLDAVDPVPAGRPDLRFEVEPHNCFACGSLSEHGMQLDLHVDGDRCWTEVELANR
jgi:hypothetical protein